MTKITVTIDISETDWIDVELTGEVSWENTSIGGYEYGGLKGYDEGYDVPVMDKKPSWDRSKYNRKDNKIIKEWIDNFDSIWIEMFEKQAEKDGKPKRLPE